MDPRSVTPEVSAQVAGICTSLNGGSHPSLGVLCFLVQSGQVPPQAQAAISRVIIRKADFNFPGRGPKFRFDLKFKFDFDKDTMEFKFKDGDGEIKFKLKKNGKSKFDLKGFGLGRIKDKVGPDHDDHDDDDDDD